MKQTTFCNICKKIIPVPLYPDRNIFYIREYDLCEKCHDDLNYAVEHNLKTIKHPFEFDWFNKVQSQYLLDGEKTNRIAVPGR